MVDIRRVPLLLVILFAAVIGGYLIIKSQIQKDFVIEEIKEISDIIVEPVLEFKWTYIYNGTTGEYTEHGEQPLAIFPYYYNNIPYALTIVEAFNNGYSKGYVRLHNLLTKSIVSEVVIEDFLSSEINNIFYYIDRSGKLIATIFRLDNIIHKIVVDKENITEVKTINIENLLGSPDIYIEYAIIFEGTDRDYIVLSAMNCIKDLCNAETMILDEYGNVTYKIRYGEYPYDIDLYETKNTVVYIVEMGEYDTIVTYYIVFDKNTKTFVQIGNISGSLKPVIAGYDEDLVILRTENYSVIIKGSERYEITNTSETYLDVHMGWVKGDKIFGLNISYIYPREYIVYYELYNYSINGGFNIQKVAEGLFTNMTSLFYEGVGQYFSAGLYDRYIEVLGLKNKSLLVLFETSETFWRNWNMEDKRKIYLSIVDLDNYKAYNIKLAENVSYSRSSEREDTYIYESYYLYKLLDIYHPRFLIPIVQSSYVSILDKNWRLLESIYNETIVVYMLKSAVYQPQPNVTNETQSQLGSQTGLGVEIVPTSTEIDTTQINITQNVTVIEPVYPGIQSVIDIIRERPWIILLAILLLILIAASLRRRAL